MMQHHIYLVLHLLAATIWVGGHFFLILRILPSTLQQKDISILSDFRLKFGKIGMHSLLILVVTGILLAYDYNVPISDWFSFSNPIEKIVSIKLLLLFISLSLAVHAQKVVFPKLTSNRMLPAIVEIIIVTLIAVSMLILGSLVRVGGL
nr:copper resistance protein CopD [uncultured Flavobacterium sp.]